MAATIKDIARETGLSLATISKYLNGGNLREKNRAAIEAAGETSWVIGHIEAGEKGVTLC